MQRLIILALIALARANVGGYNYESNISAGGSGLIDGAHSVGGIVGGSIVGGSIGGGSIVGGSIGGGSIGGGSIGGGSVGGGISSSVGGIVGGGIGSGISNDISGGSDAGIGGDISGGEVEKEFFTFTAPEEEFEDIKPLEDIASSLKKSLQVIFIRGPENNNLANAAANLAKSAVNGRTAIYVLAKQNDVSELANKLLNSQNNKAQKPEVHFVKYRTPEDAENAQRTIQSQYDSLGGASQSHNGGVAPVLNYASKPIVSHGSPSNSYVPPQAPRNSYLPIV